VTAAPNAPPRAPATGASRTFALRKLASLGGAGPATAALVGACWLHGRALDGPVALASALEAASRHAWWWQPLVLAPLALHAGYGLTLCVRTDYNASRYGHARNWMYIFQRATGVVALLLVVHQLYAFWLPVQRGSLPPALARDALVAMLSSTAGGVPWLAMGYLLGLAACALHLGYGLWTFGVGWGLTAGRRAQRWSAVACTLVGIAVFGWSAHTLVALATGWRLGAPAGAPAGACPAPEGAP
jgi:succinate dehydrogenase/fumarate reductase cytochrome b subunit